MSRPTAAKRFAAKVNTAGPVSLYRGAPGPCHLWTGGTVDDRAGQFGEHYGKFWHAGRMVRAHRYAYEQANGPIPDGLEVDHKCRRRDCVNERHLEAVDHRTNTLRSTGPTAANARKTHCPAGHAYDAANTYRGSDGGRKCRACKRARARGEQHLAPVATLTAPTLERTAA
ncbi:HNH endonuclease signature motif containing protein [Streptomyces sp. BB1-1-1]|uniref:HNH endonuclease signature motif containing protein n=1 Tax=Streptomyces sp. BB1-1-1 TaxID=3074430 RepID=UPI002877E84B|nr:HNH endonuclease signature motif containing protein [Streptomyces sp. BB1-1-1]WND36947.1 HNH endonuclease signature motif containing protein [Streptomyces sp. BB1-1-1]